LDSAQEPSNSPLIPDRLYHATPLHYLPRILIDGALYPKSVLTDRNIEPRRTAQRRDLMLGLSNYVHLAMKLHTPLLQHKLGKGYPHAALVYRAAPVLAMAGVGLMTQNTKSWRERSAYLPVLDAAEQAALLKQWSLGRRQGLEVLVPYGLSMEYLSEIVFFSPEHRDVIFAFTRAAGQTQPLTMDASTGFKPKENQELDTYLELCVRLGSAPHPPRIPFD
jgi:hypothetical protein